MTKNSYAAIVGAGPYGLSASAFLRAAGVETRTFGDPMSFWSNQMPRGMCLRSSWIASFIADPHDALTLDAFLKQNGGHFSKPIPLDHFVEYGLWYQQKAVPDLDRRFILEIDLHEKGFQITLSDGERFVARRVIVAGGIGSFALRPPEFDGLPPSLVSHSSEHRDLSKFAGRRLIVVGGGQSATESAALLREVGAEVELIARQDKLNWVGMHPHLHRMGLLSSMLYSRHDVGPAGLSRLVAMPHAFRRFPRSLQERMAYRAIRPAVAGWLAPRLAGLELTLNRHVVSANPRDGKIHLCLDDGSDRLVDHVMLATGYRVDISQYSFLSQPLLNRIESVNGYPVLRRGLESSVPGLHFLGKPAARSFGPLLGFVSGTGFAAAELLSQIKADYRRTTNGVKAL